MKRTGIGVALLLLIIVAIAIAFKFSSRFSVSRSINLVDHVKIDILTRRSYFQLEEGGNYYRISKAGKCIVEPSYLQMPPPPWSLEVKHDDATDLSIIIDSREPSHILILYDHSNNYSLPAGLPNEIAAAKLDEADRYADILNNSMRPPEMPAYHIWK